TALNFTLASKPYNMVAEIDFANLPASAGQIAIAMLQGSLIKPGFANTFAAELKKPVSNIPLATAPVSLAANTSMIVVQPITSAPSMNIATTSANAGEWTDKFMRI